MPATNLPMERSENARSSSSMQSPSETVYFHVASRLATTLKRPSLQDLSILFSAEYNKIDYIQNLFINETFSNESYREQSFGSKINFESNQFHVDVGTVTQCFFIQSVSSYC